MYGNQSIQKAINTQMHFCVLMQFCFCGSRCKINILILNYQTFLRILMLLCADLLIETNKSSYQSTNKRTNQAIN